MTVLAAITICFLALAVASLVSVYSYGRFAKQARGKPTRALPVSDGETSLDTSIAEMVRQHPDQNGLSLLANNLQAFAARVHSARSAGRSLDLQYYYWKNDLTGGLLGKEIIAAAERGVRVRLLLDDINTRGGDSTYLSLDSHPNIEVRLFNPVRNRTNALRRGLELLLRVWSTTHRMHNKAWIADGRLAIVGGRNIGDAYFDASTASNFRDMDLLLLGRRERRVLRLHVVGHLGPVRVARITRVGVVDRDEDDRDRHCKDRRPHEPAPPAARLPDLRCECVPHLKNRHRR